MKGHITSFTKKEDVRGYIFYCGSLEGGKYAIVYANKELVEKCDAAIAGRDKVTFEVDNPVAAKWTMFCYYPHHISVASPNIVKTETKVEEKPKEEIVIIRVPLVECSFRDYDIRLPKNFKEDYPGIRFYRGWSNSPKKFEYIGKKWLPELTFSSLLNKIKKVFKGDLIIEVKKIFCTDYYSRNEIVSVKIDDEELKAIKKLLVEYRTNLEYKKLLNEARRTKNFYNRQTLKAKLQEINPDITDDDIEKKFDRDKYDYRCYEVLKTNTKSEDVFLSLNGFLFILKDERTGIDWRIMETPGASAATYIFNAKLPINDLISKLVITPKSCIIADANIQNELGFIGRIVHRSYKQWKEQLEEVLKFKLVVSFLMTPDAVFQVEKIKKEYKK